MKEVLEINRKLINNQKHEKNNINSDINSNLIPTTILYCSILVILK